MAQGHSPGRACPAVHPSGQGLDYLLFRPRGRQAGARTALQEEKKGRCLDSFYVANDKFSLDGKSSRLPKIGTVAMTETLRFEGKILGATVSRTADRWFVAVQVDVPEHQALRRRSGHGTVGVDLGLKAAATLSNGESIQAPKPLKAALRRMKTRSRRLSRQLEAAKLAVGLAPGARLPKGTRLPVSNNRRKSAAKLARLHARIATSERIPPTSSRQGSAAKTKRW